MMVPLVFCLLQFINFFVGTSVTHANIKTIKSSCVQYAYYAGGPDVTGGGDIMPSV